MFLFFLTIEMNVSYVVAESKLAFGIVVYLSMMYFLSHIQFRFVSCLSSMLNSSCEIVVHPCTLGVEAHVKSIPLLLTYF